MRTYHILFKEKAGAPVSKGKNFIATDAVNALLDFHEKYPQAIFMTLYDVEAMSSFNTNIEAIQQQADIDDVKSFYHPAS